jgi:hypothetical protein
MPKVVIAECSNMLDTSVEQAVDKSTQGNNQNYGGSTITEEKMMAVNETS